MTVGRQFGRESLIYLGGFVGMGIVQFAAVPVYARALGPQGYGHLTVAVAAAAALAGVMALGGDTALARFWPEHPTMEARRALASTWIAFLLGWSVAISVLASVVVVLLWRGGAVGDGLGAVLVVSFVGAVPTLLSSMLAQVLRNRFQAVPYAVSTVLISALAVSMGMAVGIGLGLGAAGVALGILAGQGVGVLLRLWLVRDAVTIRIDRALLPPLLRFGAPLVPASLATWVFTGADRIALGFFGSASDVGAYAVAAAIVGPFQVINVAMGQAWIPRITALNADYPQKARDATANAVFLALSALGLVAVALGALAPWAIEIVGGPDYSAGTAALPALALGAALAGTAVFSSTGLLLAKKTMTVTLVTAGAAGIDIALLALLVPLGGPLGAAVSVCLASLVMAGGLLHQANRYYSIRVDRPRTATVVLILVGQTALNTALPGSMWAIVGLACSAAVVLALNPLRKDLWMIGRPRRATRR